MNEQEFFALVSRVQLGFLVHVAAETIRAQLQSEGIAEDKIEAALVRGKRMADVRLSKAHP